MSSRSTDPPQPVEPSGQDTRLVQRLREGEEAAFEELVRGEAPRLLAVARRLLRDESEAQDVLQEAFLSAFRSIDGFQQGSLLSTWLHRILVNAALMKLRSKRRRPEESLDELLPRFLEDGHHEVRPRSWPGTAEELLDRQQRRELVRRCIDQLPETFRTVLLLRDIEELSTREAASLLEITPNAVKVRLHRARQALRTLLDPHMRETG